jgi:hypothetical protein
MGHDRFRPNHPQLRIHNHPHISFKYIYNLQLMRKPYITHVKEIIIMQVLEFVPTSIAAGKNSRALRQ